MQRLTPFVVKKIEEKLSCSITDKGACAELRRHLINTESEDGRFSLNTIKRWFGVIEKQVEPQQNGLEAIAQYLDYPSWAALTLEQEYNQTKIKTEEDYISELLPEYTTLLQGIQDYQFKKEQAKTKEDILHCKNKIEELKKRQNTIKDAIVQLSDILTNPAPYQSDFDKIYMLFENSQFDEANQLLDEDRLKEEQATLLRSLKKKDYEETLIQQQLYKNALCFCIKAEICKSFNQLDEVENYYYLSLDSMRIFKTLFHLGEFHLLYKEDNISALHFFEEMESRRDEILESFENNNFQPNSQTDFSLYIDSLFYRGRIHFNQKNFGEGHRIMDLLMGAYSNVYKDEGKEIQLRIADIYNEQGNYLSKEKDYDQAQDFYHKSLDIYKRFSEFDYFETSINLGSCYIDNSEFEPAKKELKTACDYFSAKQRNAETIEEQQRYRLRVGKCHYVLGNMHKKQTDYESAIKSYKIALIVFEKMNEIIPSLNSKLDIAHTLMAIGYIYRTIGDFHKDDEYGQRTFQFFEDNPDVNEYYRQIILGIYEEKEEQEIS